jgi:hypothetical protein
MRHDTTCACNGNVRTVVDKMLIVTSIHRMSNNDKSEASTVDGSDVALRLAFADKAEFLLVRILAALGYESDKLTPSSLLAGIAAWVTLLIASKNDVNGRFASFWMHAFLDAWKDLSVLDAAEASTAAVNEFAKRYPPMLDDVLLDEHGRDTQSDIEALSIELDKQTIIANNLERTRDVLLEVNERHASELATCRIQLEERTAQRDQLIRDVYGALVPLSKPERVEPGQRWAFVMTCTEHHLGTTSVFEDASGCRYTAFSKDVINGHYLGTDKV